MSDHLSGSRAHRLASAGNRIAIGFFFLTPVAFGLWAVLLPMDANWDLRNYHYYNAYAFLTGRTGYDMLVAQLPSFFNPLLDVPFYLAAQSWPPRLIGFLLGAVQGLNVLPLFAIAYVVLDHLDRPRRAASAAALALLGMVGAGALGELGTTFNDNVVTLGPLTALWLILREQPALIGPPWRRALGVLVLAGFAAGAAVGLKQTVVTLAFGLCAALLVVPAKPLRRLVLAVVLGVAVILGILATSGFWMLDLWRDYANPLFPFFNNVFESPWADVDDYRGVFYIPRSFWVRGFFPFAYLLDPHLTGDADFFDLRIAACFALFVAAGGAILWRRGRGNRTVPGEVWNDRVRYLIAFWLVAYAAWLWIYCIHRYLIALEMLAPLLIVILIGVLGLPRRATVTVTVLALAAVTFSVKPPDWGRIPWTEKWVMATAPAIADPKDTLVLITGYEPLSYLIPFFPPEIRFIRIHGGFNWPGWKTTRFWTLFHRLIDDHQGPIYVLYNPHEEGFARLHLAEYGLALAAGRCRTMPSNIGYLPYALCPLKRDARRLKVLEDEDRRPKKLLAEATPNNTMLKDVN